MTIAEIETEGVIADLFPAHDGDGGEIFLRRASVLLTKNIPLALGFSTRRGGAELWAGQVALAPIAP